jgi:hypothetical protein
MRNRGPAAGAVAVGLVVRSVRDPLGPREIPIRPMRTVAGDPLGRDYVERASALQRRILDLCGASDPVDHSRARSASGRPNRSAARFGHIDRRTRGIRSILPTDEMEPEESRLVLKHLPAAFDK